MADIFDFKDYRTYLRSCQRRHPATKRAITTEDWTVRLGYRSPRSVAMVINGNRFPSSDFIDVLARDLKLSATRKRYFELLVLKEKHVADVERTLQLETELDSLNPRADYKSVDEKRFRLISDWYHLVLRQLVSGENFKEDPAIIAAQLRNKVSPEFVQLSLQGMLRSGFLVRDASGALNRADGKALEASSPTPSRAIQKFHAQMMQRAVEALVEQNPDNREMHSITLSFDIERLHDAKAAIRDFLATFNKNYTSDNSGRVYQMGLQFFEHTTQLEP